MCSTIRFLKIRISKKTRTVEIMVVIMERKSTACASFSSLGNMMANSYFQLATEVITATIAA